MPITFSSVSFDPGEEPEMIEQAAVNSVNDSVSITLSENFVGLMMFSKFLLPIVSVRLINAIGVGKVPIICRERE